MMSYSRPMAVTPWNNKKTTLTQQEESNLSKSMGDIPGFDLLSRATSEITSIDHRGYLLKRSNDPHRSISPFPEYFPGNEDDEHDDAERRNYNMPLHMRDDLQAPNLMMPLPPPTTVTSPERTIVVETTTGKEEARLIIPRTKNTANSAKAAKSLIEQSSALLADFFGMEVEVEEEDSYSELTTITPRNNTNATIITTPTKSAPALITPPTITQRNSVTRSSPITFSPIHRRDSAPSPRSPAYAEPPLDFVDQKDGHLWRAKYCVLEEGVLYFYRNASDGESPEAHSERNQQQQDEPQVHDLSKSPMPRKYVSQRLDATSVIWEKRVALECVGAVRSAELEYGPFAFELLADNGDRLVLRASNAQEVKEWLFQFHRSLASFVKNFMNAMDLHTRPAIIAMPPLKGSPLGGGYSPATLGTTPVSLRFNKALSASLSHGHGRSGMHRRRRAKEEEEKNEAATPATSDLMQFSIEALPVTPARAATPPRQPTAEPEVAGGCPPEMERPVTTPKGKYVPPHLRAPKTLEKKKKASAYVPPHLRRKLETNTEQPAPAAVKQPPAVEALKKTPPSPRDSPVWLGGCADPANGSIMDAAYKKRSSSKVRKVTAESYGFYGGGNKNNSEVSLHWEVGTVSECGVRNSNEDSFLICSSASKAFASLGDQRTDYGKHDPAFFGIFDGHCGNEAARFAAERMNHYLYKEWPTHDNNMGPAQVVLAVEAALTTLDTDFCRICVEDGRNWESGSTAVVAAIVDEHLVVTNIGDCQAVLCRSTPDALTELTEGDGHLHDALDSDGWTHLEIDEDLSAHWAQATSGEPPAEDDKSMRQWYWKEMADMHSPSREDEQRRIEENNGWITTETEIPGMGQLQRMDFCDEAVVEILKRCFSDRYNQSQSSSAQKKNCSSAPQRIIQIARVCGELAVSRAIGDRDFKANQQNTNGALDDGNNGDVWWDCPPYLPYPEGHSGKFKGDLVSSVAESRTMKLSLEGHIDEFLVLACDGLWDVMDPDDAVRVTRELLFDKKWPARKAAARLAELAIHLGSSDNITVIVIRFSREAS